MRYLVRAAVTDDLEALYEMAKLTGGGFTNLPPDRDALAERLARSQAAFESDGEHPADHVYIHVLVNTESGRVCGTAQTFSLIGETWPFYSYRLANITQTSKELGRTFKANTLSLTTDMDGSSEVGGLFLHPNERAGGLGRLLARSRYLFIRQHRARFADRVIAELRGIVDEAGCAPFWDALAGKFFGMTFQEADHFNSLHGTQFIADLMPKHPIYLAMLPESALRVIGVPHSQGRAAMVMLESEGFRYDGYVDIFDGGPTMTAMTDQIRTVRESIAGQILFGEPMTVRPALVGTGHLQNFRVGTAHIDGDVDIRMDAGDSALLGVSPGDDVLHVPV
ncbi:MAG: arginine N-succinyltransferase [Sphingobium sp.]